METCVRFSGKLLHSSRQGASAFIDSLHRIPLLLQQQAWQGCTMDRNQSKHIDLVLKSLPAAMEQLKVHGQEAAIEITHSKLLDTFTQTL